MDTARQATPLETSLAFLLTLRDERSGAWRGDAGYKLNDRWRVTRADVPHVGVTALALEALVMGGQCEQETVAGSRMAIREAKEFLLDHQAPDGYFSSSGTRLRSHAYVLAALSRLAVVDSSPRLVDAVQRGLQFSLEARGEETPGWYFEPLSRRADLIETAFQMQAIEAAVQALESADDAATLRLLVGALEAREAVAGFARSAFSEVETLGAGYRRQLPSVDTRVYRADYRATASGLWIERKWLAGSASELIQIADAVAAFRSARDLQDGGLHFTILDAEMLLARVETGAQRRGPLASVTTGLAMEAVSILASTRASDGQFWRGVGAGPSFTQAAGCLVLAQANKGSRFLFSVTMVDDKGAEEFVDIPWDTTVFDCLAARGGAAALPEDTTSLVLIRGEPSADPLRLPVDLEAILRGDTTSNYRLQSGDVLRVIKGDK